MDSSCADKLEALFGQAAGIARDLWLNGWAEAGAGNFSLRIDLMQGAVEELEDKGGSWIGLPSRTPSLGGAAILITAGGSRFRTMDRDPAGGMGLVVLDEEGERCRVMKGFEQGAEPSSELRMHLEAQAALIAARSGRERAVIHVHAPRLLTLSGFLGCTSESLTRVLWGVHGECIALLPEGVGVLPWALPGSGALARLTAEGLCRRRLLVWPYHGVVAAGRDLDEAFGLIETGEKAAGMYLDAARYGGEPELLDVSRLLDIAQACGVEPDSDMMGYSFQTGSKRGKGR
ncbi:MAG: rhamnulose-1-phosphate aldolase [Desulfobacteraceae bacterium]